MSATFDIPPTFNSASDSGGGRIAAAVLVFAVLATHAAAAQTPEGTWRGSVHQPYENGSSVYPVVVAFAKGNRITISYPIQRCLGALLPAGGARYTERILEPKGGDPARCVDGGMVTLTPRDDGTLAWTWNLVIDGEAIAADAVLTRQDQTGP